jgi:hypothetical protein
MTSLKGSAMYSAFRSERISRSSGLGPRDGQPPIVKLSPSKRHALVSCFNAGGLSKKDGAWHGQRGNRPISGSTTADLARDGLLTLTIKYRSGSAQLTERGNRFARVLLGRELIKLLD